MHATKKRKLNGHGAPGDVGEPPKKLAKEQSPPPSLEDVEDSGGDAPKTFRDLGLIDQLCDSCEELGYKAPTAIQAQAIPLAIQGRDVIGLAETGSGKTAAFALPILQALMDKPQHFFGLILAPTRELAIQISQAIEALGSLISVRCAVLVGGIDMVPQAIALGKRPHIIVATPGRLLDHLENTKGFSLRNLKYLVMDEADRLLDMDFGPILDKILRVLPRENRHTYLFSATMTTKVDKLTRVSLQNPLKVSVSSSSHQTVSTLLQYYSFFPHKYKDLYLVHLLNDLKGQTTIVFTRTVVETQRIAFLLRALGLRAVPIHGQLSQSMRLGALHRFKEGVDPIMIATDVAARGLDIPSVDAVVNFDLPSDSKTYVHRVGRTARAGRSGRAVSFVTQYDVEIWQRIEAALTRQLPEYPTDEDAVLLLSESVSEAQRMAQKSMKDLADKKGRGLKGKKGKKFGRDDMDREER